MSNNKQQTQQQPTPVATQQFQPFYYYTANGQVQIGYPQMLSQMHAGMYKNGGFPYAMPNGMMPFYYNNAFLQQQTVNNEHNLGGANMAQMSHRGSVGGNLPAVNMLNQNNMNSTNAVGLTTKNKTGITKSKDQKSKKLVKKLVQAQSSTNSESSDHGVHMSSKNESSDHGSHSCEHEANQKSELTTKVTAVKPKKSKPAKPCKKVICVDLPEDLQSIETVTNRFQQYGEILLVRVLKPGKVMPFDLKVYSGKIHDLGQTVCAIVEFETPLAASTAVQKEEGQLRVAALQQGAHVALYGSVDNDTSKAHSEHSSEHTHGESGIHNQSSFTSRSGSSHTGTHSNRDDMSHDSHDEFEVDQIEQQQRKQSIPALKNNPFLPNFKPRSSFCRGSQPPSKNLQIEVNAKNSQKTQSIEAHQKLVAEVSGVSAVSTCETIKNVEIEKAPLTEQITAIPNPMAQDIDIERKKAESKIISTNNGRITTALNITLTSSVVNSGSTGLVVNRSATKLDLTNRRHPKIINLRACDLLPPPTRPIGRSSPGLLSDPSDEFLMENFLARSVKKYSRDYLMSLKETRRASVFPKGMKNIPEIMPSYNQA